MTDHTVTVLFLIARDFLDMPIVGFNVIKEITKHFDRGSSARVNGSLVALLTSSLTFVDRRHVEVFVQPAKELATVKSRNQNMVIPVNGPLLF